MIRLKKKSTDLCTHYGTKDHTKVACPTDISHMNKNTKYSFKGKNNPFKKNQPLQRKSICIRKKLSMNLFKGTGMCIEKNNQYFNKWINRYLNHPFYLNHTFDQIKTPNIFGFLNLISDSFM